MTDNTAQLLKRFNAKRPDAFGDVYDLLYRELYNYASALYAQTPQVDVRDVIQDSFMDLLEKPALHFGSLQGIKYFILLMIKNRWVSYCRHAAMALGVHRDLRQEIMSASLHVVESEFVNEMPTVLGMLPEECARTFSLILKGWSVNEIAEQLGKQPSTIYTQKKRAAEILKAAFDLNEK